MSILAKVILPGSGAGPALHMQGPFSFWGGVDPATGKLTDPTNAHFGQSIAGTVFFVPETRGSSSSIAVLLELLKSGRAPEAIVLGEIDAIAGLGILVAREMGWKSIPLLVMPSALQSTFRNAARITVVSDGTVFDASSGATSGTAV